MKKLLTQNWIILLIAVLYLTLRLINLSGFPIFNDESTYIRYGLHELFEANHQPYSLLIGKEPLLPYLYAVFGSRSSNLIDGARLVTIFFGFLTLTGLFLFTKSLLDKKVAFYTCLFYCIAPYTVFFDRLALLDSPVSTIAIWTLYLTQLLLKNARRRYAIGLGVLMGIGLWVKTSDLFYIFLPLISYAIYFFIKKDAKFSKGKMFTAAIGICLIIFIPLYTNPFYAIHMQLLQQYTYPLYTVFFFPFLVWWNNFADLTEWLFFYLTPPLFLLAIASLIIVTKQKKFWLVQLWFYLPLIYEILYAKLFTSRHVLLLTIPLFIFAGYGFSLLLKRWKIPAIILGICIFSWALFDSIVLLTSPQQYPFVFADRAKVDAEQYFYGYPSGYGIQEAVDYLNQTASMQNIIVLIRNDHGNPEDAMFAYFDYKPNFIVIPMNNPTTDVPQVFQKYGSNYPIYFVARGGYNAGLEKYFVSEKIFAKPNDKEFVGVAKLQPLQQAVAKAPASWDTFTNPAMHLTFNYPKQYHIHQVNNTTVELLKDPLQTDLSTKFVFYVTTVAANDSSINIPLPIKVGNLVSVKPVTHDGFMSAVGKYSTGAQILYMKHESELIAVYLPTSKTIKEDDYNQILKSIRSN